jgi:serine/threonine protein kinase
MEAANLSHHAQREKEILIELQGHPFIIGMLGRYMDEESLYFVFEYAPNRSLHDMIRDHEVFSLDLVRAVTA